MAKNQKAADGRKESEKAASDRRRAEYLAFKESGGSPSGYCAPAASSWDSAPAASSRDSTSATRVQQDDPRHFAYIKQDRDLSPDQRRKAAQAAENRKAVDARKEIEKAAADCRHAVYLSSKAGRGSSSGYTVCPCCLQLGRCPCCPCAAGRSSLRCPHPAGQAFGP